MSSTFCYAKENIFLYIPSCWRIFDSIVFCWKLGFKVTKTPIEFPYCCFESFYTVLRKTVNIIISRRDMGSRRSVKFSYFLHRLIQIQKLIKLRTITGEWIRERPEYLPYLWLSGFHFYFCTLIGFSFSNLISFTPAKNILSISG